MGRDPPSPVGDGGVTRCELQGGDREALSHGYVPDGGAAPVLVGRNVARVLSPKIYPRGFAEPEAADVLLELLATQRLCHLDRPHVARLFEDIPRSHDLRLVRHGVVDDAVCHLYVIRNDERARRRDRPLLQRRRHGEDLEGGTRLIGVGQDSIPLRLDGCTVEAVVVVAGRVGERHDGAVLDAHDDTDGAPGIVFLDGGLEVLLQLLLHRGVQGQGNVLTVAEGLVVAGLDATERVAVVSQIPHQLAGQVSLWIHPDGVWNHRDTLYPEPPDLLRGLVLDTGGDDAVAAEAAVSAALRERRFYLCHALIRLGADHTRERPGNLRRLLYLIGAGDDACGLEARRELPAVGAHYAAAGLRRNRRGPPHFPFGSEGLVPIAVRDDHLHGPYAQEQADHHERYCHHPQPPAADRPRHVARGRSGSAGYATANILAVSVQVDDLTTGTPEAGVLSGAAADFRASGVAPGSATATSLLSLLPHLVFHPPRLCRKPRDPQPWGLASPAFQRRGILSCPPQTAPRSEPPASPLRARPGRAAPRDLRPCP